MLFKKNRFSPVLQKHILVLKKKNGTTDYTRDHLACFRYLDKDPIHFIINHWPSRSGGQMRSEPR